MQLFQDVADRSSDAVIVSQSPGRTLIPIVAIYSSAQPAGIGAQTKLLRSVHEAVHIRWTKHRPSQSYRYRDIQDPGISNVWSP